MLCQYVQHLRGTNAQTVQRFNLASHLRKTMWATTWLATIKALFDDGFLRFLNPSWSQLAKMGPNCADDACMRGARARQRHHHHHNWGPILILGRRKDKKILKPLETIEIARTSLLQRRPGIRCIGAPFGLVLEEGTARLASAARREKKNPRGARLRHGSASMNYKRHKGRGKRAHPRFLS